MQSAKTVSRRGKGGGGGGETGCGNPGENRVGRLREARKYGAGNVITKVVGCGKGGCVCVRQSVSVAVAPNKQSTRSKGSNKTVGSFELYLESKNCANPVLHMKYRPENS